MANKYFKLFCVLIFIFCGVDQVFGGPSVPPPVPLPIDGGVLGLGAIAIGYAIKKIHDNSKK